MPQKNTVLTKSEINRELSFADRLTLLSPDGKTKVKIRVHNDCDVHSPLKDYIDLGTARLFCWAETNRTYVPDGTTEIRNYDELTASAYDALCAEEYKTPYFDACPILGTLRDCDGYTFAEVTSFDEHTTGLTSNELGELYDEIADFLKDCTNKENIGEAGTKAIMCEVFDGHPSPDELIQSRVGNLICSEQRSAGGRSHRVSFIAVDRADGLNTPEFLDGVASTLGMYLDGEVYGLTVKTFTKCEACKKWHHKESVHDALWGIYGRANFGEFVNEMAGDLTGYTEK